MLATKKSSDKTLPQDITTEELMKVDYHFNYSENELKADWKRLKKITTFKSGSQWKPEAGRWGYRPNPRRYRRYYPA